MLIEGTLVPQELLIEIKSTTKNNQNSKFIWRETFSKLFLSQTPHIYIGLHKEGKFSKIVKKRLSDPDMVERARKTQVPFRKLQIILEWIKSVVFELGTGKKLSLVYKNRRLALYERKNGRNALPKEWLKMFEENI